MIRIRYENLSSGLHGKAECAARRTTVYLLPGLTGSQRKAALRRLRQEASRGCGPALPLPQLVVALGADGTRRALRGAAAVVRLHPAASLLPAVLAGTLMTLFVLGSMPIAHLPGEGAPAGPGPAARAGVVRGAGGGAGNTGYLEQRNAATGPGSAAAAAVTGLGYGAFGSAGAPYPATGSAVAAGSRTGHPTPACLSAGPFGACAPL